MSVRRWSVAAIAIAAGAIVSACDGCASAPAGPVSPTTDTATCILPTIARDVAAGDPWSQCLSDAENFCGATEPTVVSVWSGHVNAEVIEGVPVKMPVPGMDGGH